MQRTMLLLIIFLLILMTTGCARVVAGAEEGQGVMMGGLIFENQSDKEIVVFSIIFDGNSKLPGIVLGAGARKTLMGRIASVRGVANVKYTEGFVGDASFSVDLERVEYSGGLDRLIMRLGKDKKWVLIGENGGEEVFRAVETTRVDVPATNADP